MTPQSASGSGPETGAVVSGRPPSHWTWSIPRDSLPFSDNEGYWSPTNPVSVLTPVYTRFGTYLGVVEAMLDVGHFVDLLESAVRSDAALANVTIVVFDRETLDLVVDTSTPQSGRIRRIAS